MPSAATHAATLPLPPTSPLKPAAQPAWRRKVVEVGRRTTAALRDAAGTLSFVGELLLAFGRLLRGRSQMRRVDLVYQLDQSGPRSVPIVALVCGLVGLILAYMGAAQLQRFGVQSFVADLVTVGVVREIAALMVGVIMSGRVGAAFAAQLGTMQANDEIDALRVTGIEPMDHLVLPRVLAMLLVSPLLTAIGAVVGLLCGMGVAVAVFGIDPADFIARGLQSLTPAHVMVGLGKGVVYALLVAIAGCREGMKAGHSAQSVGEVTTTAVVKAIVWIVVAASALTVMLQRLDW